jgi:hypothetical protein
VTAFEFVPELVRLTPRLISYQAAGELLAGNYTSCCQPEHQYVLEIVKRRCGIDIPIPLVRPLHPLRRGDKVLVIKVVNIRPVSPTEMLTEEEVRKGRIYFLLRTIP